MVSLLVSTEWLTEHLDDDNVRIFDCTVIFVPDEKAGFQTMSGKANYDEGHIPNAAFIDLSGEFSDTSSPFMFALPSEDAFREQLGKHGIDNTTHVVLYAAGGVMWATRFWWMLQAHSITNVSVLDGGFEKWQREGRPISQEAVNHPPTEPQTAFDSRLLATTEEVRDLITSGASCVVNALPAENHKAGHIPQTENVPFTAVMNDDGTFLPEARLRDTFAAVGALNEERIVSYCGGGIAATVVAFALALVGRNDVAVYDGSMQTWTSDPANPVERGGD